MPPSSPFSFRQIQDVPMDLARTLATTTGDYIHDRKEIVPLIAALPWVARAEPEHLYLPQDYAFPMCTRSGIRCLASIWLSMLLCRRPDNAPELAAQLPMARLPWQLHPGFMWLSISHCSVREFFMMLWVAHTGSSHMSHENVTLRGHPRKGWGISSMQQPISRQSPQFC